jgi:hypothetical protein
VIAKTLATERLGGAAADGEFAVCLGTGVLQTIERSVP